MALKVYTGIKKLATTTFIILGFLAIVNWPLPADPSYQSHSDQKKSKQHPVMVAQSETRPLTKEKTAPSSGSSASESKTQEKEESDEAQQKPLKEFRPSERIEAEQAVDFPYDI
ncbi:MAG: hypothetical protein PVF26_16190 [Desulfobacterales bacterium]|jgi:hypothetical protein